MTDEATDYPGVDALALDANAVAGLLHEIFGSEMTAAASQCAHCGNQAQMGTLRAYIGLGVVLRCSVCQEIVIRIATMPDGSHRIDMRGAAFLGL
jgi:NAD-dependent SIR2 family protein deacetylase